jgi:hypothetical protein
MNSPRTNKLAIPRIIPPRSVVRLVSADERTPVWRRFLGQRFQIGYYSRQDGLGTIWLVDDSGDYCQTTDRKSLIKHFVFEHISKETDLFGSRQ